MQIAGDASIVCARHSSNGGVSALRGEELERLKTSQALHVRYASRRR